MSSFFPSYALVPALVPCFFVMACGGKTKPRSSADSVASPDGTAAEGQAGSGRRFVVGPGPTTKQPVVDDYHGTKVTDPYRWLENSDSPDVKRWTAWENAFTRKTLDPLPGRASLHAQLAQLVRIGVVTAPSVRRGGPGLDRYFHSKRTGEQNQPVYYVRDGAFGGDRPLIDPGALSPDGTTSLDWAEPSWDGTMVAWGRSEGGNEESTLLVRDVATGKDLPDEIPYARHASVAWRPEDKRAFFYSRYPTPGTVPAGDEKYFRKIYEHRLGTPWKDDRAVFGEGLARTDTPSVSISPDGRWLVATVSQGWQKTELYLRDLDKGDRGTWTPIATGIDAVFNAIPRNDKLYVHTNDGAARYRLFTVDYQKPERASWKELIAEQGDVLEDVNVVGTTIVGTYLQDAATRIQRFTKTGRPYGEVPLPSLGTASVSGAWNGDEIFYQFSSFVEPPQVFHVALNGLKVTPWDRVGADFAVGDVRITRMAAHSRDGTAIPMFVVARGDVPNHGDTPTVITGYGGFNINVTPSFSPRALATVARGGVWVTAVLRGGGEFGEGWHRAGMLAHKQNVFDDVIACAQALVDAKITNPEHLGIVGGSNGGLLVAAAVVQRPDLFRAGLSLVPLTDMLRYPRFRIGSLWIPEYGTAEDKGQFAALYAYSPYHHVKDGVRYPALLITTAEGDSRVDPMHARKFAARLQEAQGDPSRPILVRVEDKAGHGAGKPASKLVDELTDELSFLFHELGVQP